MLVSLTHAKDKMTIRKFIMVAMQLSVKANRGLNRRPYVRCISYIQV